MAHGGKALAGQNPANLLACGEGMVGEKLEEVASYLGRGLVGVGVVGRCSLACAKLSGGGMRRWWGSGGELRRGEAG